MLGSLKAVAPSVPLEWILGQECKFGEKRLSPKRSACVTIRMWQLSAHTVNGRLPYAYLISEVFIVPLTHVR